MNRRHFLRASVASLGSAVALAATPKLVLADCTRRTAPNIEGPFYRPNAPFRGDLARGGDLVVTGFVRDRRCRPIEGAVVEVWQANADGDYDRRGDTFRGQVRTGGQHGDFQIHTVKPGRYLNGPTYRPAHIHVKIHANGHTPLTTQLYFPGDPYNDSDPWFRSDLLLQSAPHGCHPSPVSRMNFHFNL